MDAYHDFLARKAISDPMTGIPSPPSLPEKLFPFQRDIINWALRRGIGFELKPSYFAQAKRNLMEVGGKGASASLFDTAAA